MIDIKERERVLRARLAELDGRLHRIEAHLEQEPERDWEDHATEAEMDEVLEGLGQAGATEMEAIHAALARIEGGSYGICVRCGKDISSARLDVVPHTALCKDCAAKVARIKS
ncbi:MAG: TraR/DksA family transcriptional regulator [Alphaproteobacteria bacterium]|nr:TraR/DksA family transcriptional regulator [Alphaproteobacteria bacterium]